MFLKKLTKNGLITVDYYKNGSLKTCKGRVFNIHLKEQIISLRDEKQNIFYIHLSGIREIY
jgi:hypothetical protein